MDAETVDTTTTPQADTAAAARHEDERDGIRGWRVTLYVVWIAQLLSMLGFSFVIPFVPFYIRSLGVTDPKALRVWSGMIDSSSGIMIYVHAN